MITIDQLKAYESYLIKCRRKIHQYPETGFEEKETSRFIKDQLRDMGARISEGIGETGVIGEIAGTRPGKVVAIRADIDALNLTEEVDCEFRSTVQGKMHACGHDAHTAMVLTAAKYFSERQERFSGVIKFVFQPAEEGPYPGGAIRMMESGLLDDVSAIFALHVDPSIDTGSLEIPRHAAMAGADFFSLELTGKGGHGAAPHEGIDTIYMSSQVINAFQGIVSRRLNPVDPAVISICTINGGSSYNILPETVTMTGTIRAMDSETRRIILREIDETLKGITAWCHGQYRFELIEGYPPLFNHPEMAKKARDICGQLLGIDNVGAPDVPKMASEDFTYYLEKIPGVFIWLGCRDPKQKEVHSLHSPRFELDEAALVQGTAVLANLIAESLD